LTKPAQEHEAKRKEGERSKNNRQHQRCNGKKGMRQGFRWRIDPPPKYMHSANNRERLVSAPKD